MAVTTAPPVDPVVARRIKELADLDAAQTRERLAAEARLMAAQSAQDAKAQLAGGYTPADERIARREVRRAERAMRWETRWGAFKMRASSIWNWMKMTALRLVSGIKSAAVWVGQRTVIAAKATWSWTKYFARAAQHGVGHVGLWLTSAIRWVAGTAVVIADIAATGALVAVSLAAEAILWVARIAIGLWWVWVIGFFLWMAGRSDKGFFATTRDRQDQLRSKYVPYVPAVSVVPEEEWDEGGPVPRPSTPLQHAFRAHIVSEGATDMNFDFGSHVEDPELPSMLKDLAKDQPPAEKGYFTGALEMLERYNKKPSILRTYKQGVMGPLSKVYKDKAGYSWSDLQRGVDVMADALAEAHPQFAPKEKEEASV